MHHYFRFADEYTGNDEATRKEVNDDIKSRRDDAYANLKRFARLAEKTLQRKGPFCPAPHPCVPPVRPRDRTRLHSSHGGDVYGASGMAQEVLIDSALIQMICCCAILSIPDSFTGTCHCWLLEMQVRLYSKTTKAVGSCSPSCYS